MLESEIEESSSPLPLNLWEMTAVFLKLGSIGFGGGIAMIALMENEFVKPRRLLAIDEFLHGVALSQILGSFPVNTALFIGYRLHGFWGGLLGSLTFLLPSVVAVILLSWLYFGFHTMVVAASLVSFSNSAHPQKPRNSNLPKNPPSLAYP